MKYSSSLILFLASEPRASAFHALHSNNFITADNAGSLIAILRRNRAVASGATALVPLPKGHYPKECNIQKIDFLIRQSALRSRDRKSFFSCRDPGDDQLIDEFQEELFNLKMHPSESKNLPASATNELATLRGAFDDSEKEMPLLLQPRRCHPNKNNGTAMPSIFLELGTNSCNMSHGS